MLNPASEEQQLIIDIASTKSTNIIVDAVAGSGKTTLIMHIAAANPSMNVLVITYNKDLKAESRERAKSLGLGNVEVHTYHSLCFRYYGSTDYTDNGIEQSLRSGIVKKCNINFIVLDESQDVTPLLFNLFRDFYSGFAEKPPVCIIGDKYQMIYGFRGADTRYLTMAKDKYNFNELPWNQYGMSRSFRITNEMARFVNSVMLQEVRLIGNGPRTDSVIYMKTDSFKAANVYELIKDYAVGSVMILAPSIKSARSPVRILTNYMSSMGKKIYVPISEDAPPDMREAEGKIVCMTIHQSKGLERDVVVVYGFDNTYFMYYGKNYDPNKCPNTFYVAATRAKKLLILVQHDKNDPLKFLNMAAVRENAKVIGHNIEAGGSAKVAALKSTKYSVTQLCSHLSHDVMKEVRKYYVAELVREADVVIDVPSFVEVKDGGQTYIEGVSDLTGIAVAMQIAEELGSPYPRVDVFKQKTTNILHIANLYSAEFSGYQHKLRQIKDYDWMGENQTVEAISRTLELMDYPTKDVVKFEKQLFREVSGVLISGNADCISRDDLYEFKFVDKLVDEHFLQLAIYMFLSKGTYKNYILMNIKSGEIHKIHSTDEQLTEMVEYILYQKNRGDSQTSDAEFVAGEGAPDRVVNDIVEPSDYDDRPIEAIFSQDLLDDLY
jgi:hypothetical protein